MKKKRNYKEENHYYIQWGIATLILLIYVVGTLISYNNKMSSLAKERVLDRITKQAIQIRGYYEGMMTGYEDMLASAGEYCGQMDDICGDEVVPVLDSLVEKANFEKAYIIKNNGTAIDNTGKRYKNVELGDNVNELLEGRQKVIMVTSPEGKAMILQTGDIQSKSGIIGYIMIVYEANSMKDFIDVPIYSYSMVSSDGLVGETLGDSNLCAVGENFIETVKAMTFADGSFTTLSQGISGARSTSALVKNKNGEGFYIVTQPIAQARTEIVITVKEAQINRSAQEENQYTKKMVVKLVISLLVFVSLLVIIYIINRITFSKTSMELQNKAETDLLTDLLNKISTERKIKEYMAEHGSDQTCMMCVLDIDNFKKINDTMGHAFGDEVLASLGKQIRSEFRVSDIIGRTGGDEFIIFLKDLKTDEVVDREAKRVENFFRNFTVGEYTKYSATASIGVALFPRDGKDFDSLYKAADTALYKAKNRGKNQLAFYRDPEKTSE